MCAAVIARPSVSAGLLLLAVTFDGLAVRTMVREVESRIQDFRTPDRRGRWSAGAHRIAGRLDGPPAGLAGRRAGAGRPCRRLRATGVDDRWRRKRRPAGVVGAGRCAPGGGTGGGTRPRGCPPGQRQQQGDMPAFGPVLAVDEWIREEPTSKIGSGAWCLNY